MTFATTGAGRRPPVPPGPSAGDDEAAIAEEVETDTDDDTGEITFRRDDLPLPYRHYAGISTPWREIAATVKLLFRLKGFRTPNFQALGDLWDIFNQEIRVRCASGHEVPQIDIDALRFHEDVAGDFFADRAPEFIRAMAQLHHKLRRFYAAPGERVPTTEVVFDFPALEREVRSLLEACPELRRATTPEDCIRAVMLFDETLQARQCVDPAHPDRAKPDRVAADLFPRERPAVRAAVQVVHAKYAYRRAHDGALGDWNFPLSEILQGKPTPGLAYLNRILKDLGISHEIFVTALGLPPNQLYKLQRNPRRLLPPATVAKILTLLEIPSAATFAYACYHALLARYFRATRRGNRIVLTAPTTLHPMAQLRQVGLGGLVRAHRLVRGLRISALVQDAAFPIRKPATVSQLEHNRGEPLSFTVALGLIEYFGMGAEGLLAYLPDLPCLIPMQQPDGTRLETPAVRPYPLPGYAPVELAPDTETGKGVSAYNDARTAGTLSYRVLFERALRGWSRAELATHTGLAEATIYALERDARPPEEETLAILADPRIFDIPIEELRALAAASRPAT